MFKQGPDFQFEISGLFEISEVEITRDDFIYCTSCQIIVPILVYKKNRGPLKLVLGGVRSPANSLRKHDYSNIYHQKLKTFR